jgi:hypothetical protein
MRVSEYFNLGRTQGELDFVDVDVVGDVELYVDPRAIRLLPSEWGQECVSLIQNFFHAVLNAIRAKRDDEAVALLSGLTEPNETHLGLSRGRAQGTGLGPGLARESYESLSRSEAASSGLLTDLEDTALMVEGIDRDRVSDIATNIIREPLIRYTQAACSLYGIPVKKNVESGSLWNPHVKEWDADFVDLPVTPGGKLLLVPKVIVRRKLDFDQHEYYTHHILPFMQALELSNPNSSLVTLLKDGTPRVYKKDLKRAYGTGKRATVRITRDHPEILASYRKRKKNKPQPPLDHPELAGEEGLGRPDWEGLLEDVISAPSGKDHADEYHRAVERLLTALFYPSLAHPQVEYEIHQGRKRIDIAYSNVARSGFFSFVAQHYPAAYVFVECKNYSGDPANPELDQIAGRFSPSRGRIGLLACREFKNKDLFLERCRDTAKDDRGFIIALDDQDLAELVRVRKLYSTESEFLLLKERFEQLIN